MKIVESTKETKPITFSDIKIEDVFKVKNDPNYYMKTEKCEIDIYDHFYDDYYYDYRNVVCLSNGRMMKIHRTPEVIPVDCELIIK